MSKQSQLEIELAWQISAAKLPVPETEFIFHGTRRWRLDFAWPGFKLAMEVEGLVAPWDKERRSRHTTNKGFEGDIEKYNAAVLLGWRILRCTRKHIKSGEALQWLERALV